MSRRSGSWCRCITRLPHARTAWLALALGALLSLGACSVPAPDLPLGGGQGALGGLGGAGMTDQAVGSGAAVNDALSPNAGTTSGPGGMYPPLQ